MITFEITKKDKSGARAGTIKTEKGFINTPIFMPVGTAAAMKAMTVEHLKDANVQIILANSYHLNIQPKPELIQKLGGIHKFMNWDKPILTDSGGFQVFSLPDNEVDEQGVKFTNLKTNQTKKLTPENVIDIQNRIGADIIMPLDHCINSKADFQTAKEAAYRTIRWAERSKKALKSNQALFAIVQGAINKELRIDSIDQLAAMDFPGYALGGLAVGESLEEMTRTLQYCSNKLPENKPRYTMGIGLPEDILAAVESGIDMFDCVIPTKYARSGVLFTYGGKIRIRSGKYRHDKYPIDTKRYSYTSKHYSRAYLNHLFKANEILGAILASIHNVHFYMDFCKNMRSAIIENNFHQFKNDFLQLYHQKSKKYF